MQVVDKYGNTFGQGHLVITTKSGKSKLPVVTVAWGNITGVLANQTDLQDALDLKVPTSRTLTINGVTQDLSADRSWTISTGITVNTTPITGGTSGRLLFDNAGTVGETGGVSWDSTTATLSLFDSPFVSQAGNLSANTSFSITGTASSNYTISSSRQFIFNTGQSMYFNTDTDGGSALDRAWYFAGARTGMTGGRTYGALTVDSSGFPSFTLYNNDNGPRILLASNATSYFNGGNLLVGTTTDAGYKLDVTGTVAVRANLTVFSESEFRQNGITNYITSSLGIFRFRGWSSGVTTAYLNGWNQESFLNSPLNIGSTSTTMASMLSVYGSRTASSALAQGVYFNNTLVAAANNDVLVGLDVLPTFTNGAFTGVSNFAARFGGDVVFTSGNRNIRVLSPPTTGNGGSIVIAAGNATTSGTGGSITLSEGLGAGGPGRGSINIGTAGYTTINIGGANITVTNSGPNTGTAFRVLAGGQNGLSIYWDNLTPFMQYGLVSGRQSRFVNSTSYTFSSKVFIGTNTDAGYNFDVNGTARVQGALTATSVNSSFIGNVSSNQVIQGLGGGTGEFRFVNGAGGGWFFTWCQNSGNATPPNERMRLSSNNNLLIGTTTDAGFRLDVNGSARVQSGLTVSGSLNLNSSDISSAWIAYTPTWSTDGATQPSLGDGTITGAYKVIGKTVFVRVRLVFGTTTTAGTGTFYFSLPVNAAAGWGVQMPASILDNGNAWYQATVNGEYGGLTDRVALIGQSAGGANSSQGVTGVFPIGFGNTDSIQFNGSYESA